MRLLVLVFLLSSCSSGILKYKGEKGISKNTDFEQKVVIKGEVVEDEIAAEPLTNKVAVEAEKKSVEVKESKPTDAAKGTEKKVKPIGHISDAAKVNPIKQSKVNVKKSKSKADVPAAVVKPISTIRQPDIEDKEGFEPGVRRPKVDPFREGEVVTHSVRYFSAEAGIVNFKVKPFVEVNNHKSYNFLIDLKSSGIFSNFYSVDDQVETFLDFEDLVPYVFKLHLKESAQLKEAQSYFDQKTLKATYWENKYTEKNGQQEKKLEWDILPFSQNAFSGIFYMRIFKWDIGKQYSFRVSDDEKNIIFKGTAIKKDKLSTAAGEFNAIQVKAQIVSRGVLEQAGDILIWISDDEHKYILRIEAKIKIGTIVSEVTKIKPGKAN